MKVFFVSAPRGDKELGNIFSKLYAEINELGFTHTSDLLTTPSAKFENKMKSDKAPSFYQDMIKGINKADICIFEASTPSSGVGYLIDKSLSLNKPTVVLFYKEFNSYLLPGIDEEKLIVQIYNEKTYKKVLKEAMDIAKQRREKRFNFFISPKLLEYLEKISKKNGSTKSKFIRDLIVEHMRKEEKE